MSDPVIHPAVLALVCPSRISPRARATQTEQAEGAQVSRRHFIRLIRQKWEDWPIPTAVRWCDYCGIDFWSLTKVAIEPKALRLTKWDLKDPRVREALELSCKARGVEPTPERLAKLAQTLTLASQNYGSLGAAAR